MTEALPTKAAPPARESGAQIAARLIEAEPIKLDRLIPRNVDRARFQAMIVSEIKRNDKIRNCTPESILSAVALAARTGMEIGGPFAEAHLAPFANECVFMTDYKGLIGLATRHGVVKKVTSEVVKEADHYRVTDKTLEHEFDPFQPNADRGKTKGVYARAMLVNGEEVFDVMNVEEVEACRRKSKNPNGFGWTEFWDEMAQSKVIHRLFKKIPMTGEMRELFGELAKQEYTDAEEVTSQAPKLGNAGLRARFQLERPQTAEELPPEEPPQKKKRSVREKLDEQADVDERPKDNGLGHPPEPILTLLKLAALNNVEHQDFQKWASFVLVSIANIAHWGTLKMQEGVMIENALKDKASVDRLIQCFHTGEVFKP